MVSWVRQSRVTLPIWILCLAVLLVVGGACQRPPASGPQHRDRTTTIAVPKAVVRKATSWDGSVALVHPDGSSTLSVWPVQIRGTDAGTGAVSRRCERISQGAPYIGSDATGRVDPPKLEATATTIPRRFDPLAIADKDPCAAEFGPNWRLPTLDEFSGYAPHLAKPGAWIVRTRTGSIMAVDYAPPIELRLARAVEIPSRMRTSLTDTARVVCLSDGSAQPHPTEPSREEVEDCVRRFFASSGELAALVRLRIACREVATPADWHPIIEDLAAKVQALVDALLDPSQLQRDPDEAAEDFVVGLLETTRTCLNQPRPLLRRANEAEVQRVEDLLASLDAAHEQRIARRRSQRFAEDWRTTPTIAPEPIPQVAPQQGSPKPLHCGCARGDLACSMRCAAKGN